MRKEAALLTAEQTPNGLNYTEVPGKANDTATH